MAQDYTTDALLARVKFLAMIPSNQGQITDAEIITLAQEQLVTEIVPFVVGVKQHYYTREYTLTTANGQLLYDLPGDANVDQFHSVRVTQAGVAERALVQIPSSSRPNWLPDIIRTGGAPTHYYIEGNQIGLLPVPANAAYTVTLTYDLRQPTLVGTSAAAIVSSFLPTYTINTAATLPASFTTADADGNYPAVQGVSPLPPFSGQLGFSSPVYVDSGSSGAALYLSSTPNGGGGTPTTSLGSIAIGSRITLAGESVIPMIPAEMHPVLYQATAVAALRTLGPSDRFQTALDELHRKEAAVTQMMTTRVDEQPVRTSALSSLSPGRRRRGVW
jgi:hypothetical protein